MRVRTLNKKTPKIKNLFVVHSAIGGNRTKTPGPGAQSALRALARSGLKIGRIGAFQLLIYLIFSQVFQPRCFFLLLDLPASLTASSLFYYYSS
jgi:hypothetical protein